MRGKLFYQDVLWFKITQKSLPQILQDEGSVHYSRKRP